MPSNSHKTFNSLKGVFTTENKKRASNGDSIETGQIHDLYINSCFTASLAHTNPSDHE